jgi:hypothetical protein
MTAGVAGGAIASGTKGTAIRVASFVVAPGAVVRYCAGERTTWSIERPSSRGWMRSVCGPVCAK